MKFIKYLLVFILAFLISFKVYALTFQSNNVILYHDTDVMYQKNENQEVPIASLTKIMTAIITLENINDLNSKVTITSSDFNRLAEENLVTAGFKIGEVVTYEDLLAGLLLPSGAECAQALERNIPNFIKQMNAKAKELGMKNTNFSNTIGLDEENNYSTATDVYKMFSYALKNKDFKRIITSKSYVTSNGLTLYSSALKNDNEYLLGGKTGTTDGAGLCLASLADIDGEDFVLITLNAPYDKKGAHHLEDAANTYNYIADNYSNQKVIKKGENVLTLKTKYVKKDKIKLKANKDVVSFLPNDYDKKDITYKYKGIKILNYNIKEDTSLGKLKIYYKDKLIDTLNIKLNEKLELDIFKVLNDYKLIIIIGIIILFLIIIKKRKKK